MVSSEWNAMDTMTALAGAADVADGIAETGLFVASRAQHATHHIECRAC